jgi:hypothetical protein
MMGVDVLFLALVAHPAGLDSCHDLIIFFSLFFFVFVFNITFCLIMHTSVVQ